jgi:hypothetical protein
MIKLLAEHGAKLDVKDKQGRTPMTFAEGTFWRQSAGEQTPTIALLTVDGRESGDEMIRRLITISGTAASGRSCISPSQGQQRPQRPTASRSRPGQHFPARIPQPVLRIATTTTTKPATFHSTMPTSIIRQWTELWEKVTRSSSRTHAPSGQPRPDRNRPMRFAAPRNGHRALLNPSRIRESLRCD